VLQQIIKAGETDYMSGSEIKVVGEVGWKILVVDDEQIILDLLKRVLNREGYQVSTARFADEAVAEICSQEYDLAITAVDLRYTDALELTERIGTASPQTAIVLMTGNREEEIVRFAEAHAQGLLQKPFALDQLLTTVRVALESRAESTQEAGVVPSLESSHRAGAQA
jgi:DNA-binding response OmpR family regulator